MAPKAFSVTVRDTDMGFKEMVLGAESLQKQAYVKVGVIGQESHGDGLTVVDVATFHEFGTETVPPRSFVRATVDNNLSRIQARQDEALDAILFRGADAHEEIGKVGLQIQGMMQKRIKDRIPPPNAPSTIERKGSNVPLIDTGQLWRAISFEVGTE